MRSHTTRNTRARRSSATLPPIRGFAPVQSKAEHGTPASGTSLAEPSRPFRPATETPAPAVRRNAARSPRGTARGGLPESLKAGLEAISGFSMDDVRVHYNSPRPAGLEALAYTQGNQIHVAPGQEEHLPHEAWHAVQQKQGRVRPTMEMQGKPINDSGGLEREADVMGGRAAQRTVPAAVTPKGARGGAPASAAAPIQRLVGKWKKNWKRGVAKRGANLQGALTQQKSTPDRRLTADETNIEFRSRMKNEMAELKKSQKEMDYSQNSPGFLTRQKVGIEKELQELREGKAKKGVEGEGERGVTPTTTRNYDQTTKAVTEGAARGSTAYLSSGGKKVKTLSGGGIGALEHKLTHPSSTTNLPRVGLAERQRQIMTTARKADPLMRELAPVGGRLTQHVHTSARLNHFGGLHPGGSFGAWGPAKDELMQNGMRVLAYGAHEFGDRATNPVPRLTNPSYMTSAQIQSTATEGRPGRWSEADVNAAKMSSWRASYDRYGYRLADQYSLQDRGPERLLHTAATSKARFPDGSGGKTNVERPLDFTNYVTADHYKTAIPVTPVAKKYKATAGYGPSPYMDPKGTKSSLKLHEEKESARRDAELQWHTDESSAQREARDAAMASSQRRDRAEEERLGAR